jgi:hypothetical protein
MNTIVRRVGLGIALIALFGTTIEAGSATPAKTGKPAKLTLQVLVKGPAGLDLKNVSLELLGMARPILDVCQTAQPDAKGLASIVFADRDWEEQPEGEGSPACRGWYHLVATASGTAGAVSPILFLLNENPSFDDNPENEWGPAFAKPVDVRELIKKQQPLVLTIETGRELRGKVLTTDQKPLPGTKVNIFQDLHADSHTGHGREIFPQEAVTDQQGNFAFPQVFPNTVYIGEIVPPEAATSTPWFWKATRTKNGAFDYQENRLPLASQTPDPDLTLVMDNRPYVFSGTVQTKDGKPVAEANLQFSLAFHPDWRDYADSHTFAESKTDMAGTFKVEVTTSFVNFLGVTKEGFQDQTIDNESASPSWSVIKAGSPLAITLEKAEPEKK